MKKFISGVIVGAVLMMSTQAFGQGLNFIGKKVANETVVKVNGEDAGKAIIVENKSFIPVRDISEKIGATISFEKGGAIALTTNTSSSSAGSMVELEEAVKKQEAQISDTNKKIAETSEKVDQYQEKVAAATDKDKRQWAQNNYDAFKKTLDQLESDLVEQENKLDELKAQLTAAKR